MNYRPLPTIEDSHDFIPDLTVANCKYLSRLTVYDPEHMCKGISDS